MSKERERDELIVKTKRNMARYFTEHRHVAWVLLIGTLLWGVYGYMKMPKNKDPVIAVRTAVALCTWPGTSADKIEQLVTRKIEQKVAENAKVEKIESVSRTSLAVVYVSLLEEVNDTGREFDDIKGKLDSIRDLPQGAGPITFVKDFGDTAGLMLTVASPKVSDIEIALRARSIRHALEHAHSQAPQEASQSRASIVANFPPSLNPAPLRRVADQLVKAMEGSQVGKDIRLVDGPGFIAIDLSTALDDAALEDFTASFVEKRLRLSELHPDVWKLTVLRDLSKTEEKLRAVAGDKYSYRELDDYTDRVQRYLQSIPIVSKVTRSGVLSEQVYLDYSQERIASYGVQPTQLAEVLAARNISIPGGIIEIHGKNMAIDPSGELKTEEEIGNILVPTANGSPAYLRDLVEISRAYQSPPRFLNYYMAKDRQGNAQHTRAITLAVQMRPGEQIAEFGKAVDERLSEVKKVLPEDLIMARVSDQPLQVTENVNLFMKSLYEAVFLVVAVALIGFWEWRSALLMALSIPITLAMTFGMMHALGVDVQQVSIASLIITLGLLVDNPVVAGDAIKRAMAEGWKPLIAAWLGPTKLATAILFATITNIVAYLPFLILPGNTGRFIYTLPVVLTASLVASRIVAMSFIPLVSYYLLRPSKKPEPSLEERKQRGLVKRYYELVGKAIDRRKTVFAVAMVLLGLSILGTRGLKESFFPTDLAYLSYVDVWLPEDAPLSSTRQKAKEVEEVIRQAAIEYGRQHPGKDGKPREVLASVTSFIGGGGPRFWFSVAPELQQLNYAQLIINVADKHDTPHFKPFLQAELSKKVAGARVDLRELETGPPVGVPVSIRISGEDIATLRSIGEEVKTIFRGIPDAERIRDDWGADSVSVKLVVDSDRANFAGVTNLDVAASSAAAMNGRAVGMLRDQDKMIPIVARLRSEERAQLEDIENLYVHARAGTTEVPIRQVSQISYSLQTEKIRRRNQFRTMTVSCFPVTGKLPSQVMAAAQSRLDQIRQGLPPGYRIEVGGEQEEQKKGFNNLVQVLIISIAAIYIALVAQFKNAIKPLVVFAAIPFGVAAALLSLALMHQPFGFMAFLGIISLIGVIVSHIIVLFDFIEERRELGAPLRDALLDAGIIRLRPVMITVAATVLGLFPLALSGGPLWEPLCYAQIGGLTAASFLTLLLVPVIYTIFVKDLKIIRWEVPEEEAASPGSMNPPAV